MEHIDENNGCLVVLPGTHAEFDLLQHDYPGNGPSLTNPTGTSSITSGKTFQSGKEA
jgi:hypothetical protein